MNKFICYPKCSTCVKARNFLIEHNIEFEERDIKINNPTYEELKEWITKSGLDIKKFFNTSGLVYKDLDLSSKLPNMSEDEKIKILSTNGMLVKRPILIFGDKILVGFKEEEWKKVC